MHELGRLSSMLTDCVLGDQTLNGRIEAYSCKKAGDDKKLSKQLQQKFKRRKRSGTFTLLAGAAAASGTTGTTGWAATAGGKCQILLRFSSDSPQIFSSDFSQILLRCTVVFVTRCA